MIATPYISKRILKRNFLTLIYQLATILTQKGFSLFRLQFLQAFTICSQFKNMAFQRPKPSQSSVNLLLTLSRTMAEANIICLHLLNPAPHAKKPTKNKQTGYIILYFGNSNISKLKATTSLFINGNSIKQIASANYPVSCKKDFTKKDVGCWLDPLARFFYSRKSLSMRVHFSISF